MAKMIEVNTVKGGRVMIATNSISSVVDRSDSWSGAKNADITLDTRTVSGYDEIGYRAVNNYYEVVETYDEVINLLKEK